MCCEQIVSSCLADEAIQFRSHLNGNTQRSRASVFSVASCSLSSLYRAYWNLKNKRYFFLIDILLRSLNPPLLSIDLTTLVLRVIQQQRHRNAVKLNAVRTNHKERRRAKCQKEKERTRTDRRKKSSLKEW